MRNGRYYRFRGNGNNWWDGGSHYPLHLMIEGKRLAYRRIGEAGNA